MPFMDRKQLHGVPSSGHFRPFGLPVSPAPTGESNTASKLPSAMYSMDMQQSNGYADWEMAVKGLVPTFTICLVLDETGALMPTVFDLKWH
jgi:hypothetical protein